MKRNEFQTKFVLDDDSIEVLRKALIFANEHARASSQVARSMGDFITAQECALLAEQFQEFLTYSPEVVRVAVTVEQPELAMSAWSELYA